jgi:hypothetical protein
VRKWLNVFKGASQEQKTCEDYAGDCLIQLPGEIVSSLQIEARPFAYEAVLV